MKLHELEMNTFKIKLENMFADTDSKNEKIDVLRGLLNIDTYLLSSQVNWSSIVIDDYGRHTEMALKIAPKDSEFLFRNGNHF